MAFRQAKAYAQQHAQEWHGWRDRHQQGLAAIGLPPSVYADEARWLDFLENGHLHWHDDPWRFEFGHLSPGQLAALHRFLEAEYGQAERPPPLLGWVRVRRGIAGTT